jgi:hypothetical protein
MESVALIKRKSILSFRVLVVALALASAALIASRPAPVIDPADPHFDPKQFRFSDYSQVHDRDLFERTLLKMFPKGTSQSYVEKILVSRGGAECSKQQMPRTDTTGAQYFNCHWPPNGIGGWVVVVV